MRTPARSEFDTTPLSRLIQRDRVTRTVLHLFCSPRCHSAMRKVQLIDRYLCMRVTMAAALPPPSSWARLQRVLSVYVTS